MTGQTATHAENVDNTRANRWECAVCGAIGPNIEYDTLEEHARDKHPDQWDEFQDATGIGEDVNMSRLIGIIVLAIVAAVGTFAWTWSILGALGAYLGVTTGTYALLWVTGNV